MGSVQVTAKSIAIYRFSISRMSLLTRFLLIASASLPLFPFIFATEESLMRTNLNHSLIAMFVATLLFIPAHELMHGLVFKIFRQKVTIGFKPWSAFGPVFYATSTGSRFSRRQYQSVCLGPQALTALLAMLVLFPFPDVIKIAAAYMAALNLGGGVVDIFVAARIQRFPVDAVIEDTLDGMKVYVNKGN